MSIFDFTQEKEKRYLGCHKDGDVFVIDIFKKIDNHYYHIESFELPTKEALQEEIERLKEEYEIPNIAKAEKQIEEI